MSVALIPLRCMTTGLSDILLLSLSVSVSTILYAGYLYIQKDAIFMTFSQMWEVNTPAEAQAKIDEQKSEVIAALGGRGPQNLEEQALTLVGRDIFYTLIKEYTEKQWGRKCTELPAFIIKRLPVRMVFDNNYFNDRYQGTPIGGYNKLVDDSGLSHTNDT